MGLIYDNPTLSNNDPKYSNVLAATCICLGKIMIFYFYITTVKNQPVPDQVLDQLKSTYLFLYSVIHGALSTTGGMFNPMLATVLVSGCKGHDLLDHISK